MLLTDKWINDRRPTEEDGDALGDVILWSNPGRDPEDYTYVHWAYVNDGAPWQHTLQWGRNSGVSDVVLDDLELGARIPDVHTPID